MEIISKAGAIWGGEGGLRMLSIGTDSGVCDGVLDSVPTPWKIPAS